MDSVDIENIVIGCSHTEETWRLVEEQQFSTIVKNKTNINFSYLLTSWNGAGLFNLVYLCKRRIEREEIKKDSIKRVIIQKPQAVRFPWYTIDDFSIPFSHDGRAIKFKNHYPDGNRCGQGKEISKQKFKEIDDSKKKIVANYISDSELSFIKQIKQLYTNAKFAYYHYWGDYIIDLVHYPELAHVNTQLGTECTKIGIDNWDMIINPKEVPGCYYENGELEINSKRMFREGWIRGPVDFHPGWKFHEKLAEKIITWIQSEQNN